MLQMVSTLAEKEQPIEPEELLPRFEGEECHYCEEGTLARRQYKGEPAVVCGECDVPQIRFF